MLQKLIKVGSSAAVVIPRKSLDELGIRIGDEMKVEINVKGRTVLIEPARKVSRKIVEFTDTFIDQYRKDLEELADK